MHAHVSSGSGLHRSMDQVGIIKPWSVPYVSVFCTICVQGMPSLFLFENHTLCVCSSPEWWRCGFYNLKYLFFYNFNIIVFKYVYITSNYCACICLFKFECIFFDNSRQPLVTIDFIIVRKWMKSNGCQEGESKSIKHIALELALLII